MPPCRRNSRCRVAILMDVVTRQQPAILEFVACETLLVWRDALIVLDLCFRVDDGVGRLNVGPVGNPSVNVSRKISMPP